MAVKFYLADGTVTDLIAIPIPLFPGRTPEEILEFLKVIKPDPTTGKADDKKVMQFLATHPRTANALQISKSIPAPVSFAQTAFHAIHAFRFVNAADEAQYARYHWEPEAGVAGQTLEELQKQQPSYLFEELEARLRKAPVVQNLVLQLAADGDPTDDPTAAVARRSPACTHWAASKLSDQLQ